MGKKLTQLLIVFLLMTFHAGAESTISAKAEVKCVENGDISGEDAEFDAEFSSCDEKILDPIEGYNRLMTSFNDKVYLYMLDPVSEGYSVVVPQPVRISISNFVDNLKFPIYFINNTLQLKLDRSAKELARFILNSTIGLLGFFDVAEQMGLESSREDFGQTLGYWGVGSGFHVVLPFLGPSNVRDTLSLGADWAASPLSYTGGSYQLPNDTLEAAAIKTGEMVNTTSLHLGEYQSLKKDALDWYIFLRNSYEEKREKEINE